MRRFKRFRADFLVKYYLDPKDEAHITNTRDISAGGARFWAEREIPKDSILTLNLFVPPLGRVVDALAVVRRVRKDPRGLFFNVAVCFLDIKSEDREALHDFSEYLSQQKDARFLVDHADIVIRKD